MPSQEYFSNKQSDGKTGKPILTRNMACIYDACYFFRPRRFIFRMRESACAFFFFFTVSVVISTDFFFFWGGGGRRRHNDRLSSKVQFHFLLPEWPYQLLSSASYSRLISLIYEETKHSPQPSRSVFSLEI